MKFPKVIPVAKVNTVRHHNKRYQTKISRHVKDKRSNVKLSDELPVIGNIDTNLPISNVSKDIKKRNFNYPSTIHVTLVPNREQNNFRKPEVPLESSNETSLPYNMSTKKEHTSNGIVKKHSINDSVSTKNTEISFVSNVSVQSQASTIQIHEYLEDIPSLNVIDEKHVERKRKRRRRGICGFCFWPCCSPCCCLITGIILAFLLAAIMAGILTLFALKKSTTTVTTTTTTTSTSTTSTTTTSVTTTTTTTTTTSTTSSTTTSSTSTTTTSSTSTTTTTSTSTSTTSSTTTSSTSTSSTTITTTTETTTTVTTATSTTSTTSTTTASTDTITSNSCTSGWTGVTILYHCDNCPDITPYTQYTYTYTAISNRTRIAFSFREDTGCFALDGISVRSITAPGIELILNNSFETGTLSSWTYCNPSGAISAGEVKQNSDNFQCMSATYQAKVGSRFYYDGAVGNCDYLIQSFTTEIGTTYTISYWLFNLGISSASSADVIISI